MTASNRRAGVGKTKEKNVSPANTREPRTLERFRPNDFSALLEKFERNGRKLHSRPKTRPLR